MYKSIMFKPFYKKNKNIFLILFFLLFNNSFSQTEYIMSLENGVQVNDNRYEFDVYIKSSNLSFELTAYQCAFNFNWWSLLLNGGELNFNYINGTSEISNVPEKAVGINTADNMMELTFASSPGRDIISNTKKRIGRFRLDKTTSFNNKNPNPNWNFLGKVSTILTGTSFNNITVPANHINIITSTPVELSSFTAIQNNYGILLRWNTSSELNNLGFEIQKSMNKANKAWDVVGFINGQGNSISEKSYTFLDKNVEPEKCYYRLKQIDFDLTYEFSDVLEIDIVASDFKLLQNYPNPFNPFTTIEFNLPEPCKVKLTIFNSIGEFVELLSDDIFSSGNHSINWNAEAYASGNYILNFEAWQTDDTKKFTSTKKMILMK